MSFESFEKPDWIDIGTLCSFAMTPWPHLISDEAEGRGEDPAGGGEVKVQRYKADHEVGDGGDARQGSHSPVDAAACIQTKKEKYI